MLILNLPSAERPFVYVSQLLHHQPLHHCPPHYWTGRHHEDRMADRACHF